MISRSPLGGASASGDQKQTRDSALGPLALLSGNFFLDQTQTPCNFLCI